MSNCCGERRAAIARAGVPAGTDIRLRLDRAMDLTLRGTVTGRDYHFTPKARTVRVAAADVDGLMRMAGLVRES